MGGDDIPICTQIIVHHLIFHKSVLAIKCVHLVMIFCTLPACQHQIKIIFMVIKITENTLMINNYSLCHYSVQSVRLLAIACTFLSRQCIIIMWCCATSGDVCMDVAVQLGMRAMHDDQVLPQGFSPTRCPVKISSFI